ncbi:polysaccharide deacetylase family protein [Nonomuraea sp. MCN248]|uniref:Polysaccharide deacetylase family protein n=1 Tax=Nonomuraea corallina TaxID=2989783 RepID=A0ABT4SKG5_9ACTN|nr:polysaccharide deacetylase family protein [Nonomuraea corallina]MDA0637687.1 polysaccharide deacetylase family protein [Nonomuraea corallina]
MAVLALVTGCAAQPLARVPLMARPPAAADPETLGKRLTSMQRDWPPPAVTGCRRCVALTFDDGPGAETDRLLTMLREHGARATFFVVGQMAQAPGGAARLRRIVAEGHELGNHSWSHAELPTLPRPLIARELQRTGDLVRALTGVRMRLMRPPYGSTDDRVAAESRERGLAQILWSVDTYDWRDRVSSVVARRASRARPGAVVLLHDIHRTTVDAVPRILDTLTRKGFRMVTVSELYRTPPRPGRRYRQAPPER